MQKDGQIKKRKKDCNITKSKFFSWKRRHNFKNFKRDERKTKANTSLLNYITKQKTVTPLQSVNQRLTKRVSGQMTNKQVHRGASLKKRISGPDS